MELTLYYREQCDLCDTMRKALVVYAESHQPLGWREIDIDRDPELIRRFDTLVPVLYCGDTEVCHYFFDESALRETLALA